MFVFIVPLQMIILYLEGGNERLKSYFAFFDDLNSSQLLLLMLIVYGLVFIVYLLSMYFAWMNKEKKKDQLKPVLPESKQLKSILQKNRYLDACMNVESDLLLMILILVTVVIFSPLMAVAALLITCIYLICASVWLEYSQSNKKSIGLNASIDELLGLVAFIILTVFLALYAIRTGVEIHMLILYFFMFRLLSLALIRLQREQRKLRPIVNVLWPKGSTLN